jgi:hypothetical protein
VSVDAKGLAPNAEYSMERRCAFGPGLGGKNRTEHSWLDSDKEWNALNCWLFHFGIAS